MPSPHAVICLYKFSGISWKDSGKSRHDACVLDNGVLSSNCLICLKMEYAIARGKGAHRVEWGCQKAKFLQGANLPL